MPDPAPDPPTDLPAGRRIAEAALEVFAEQGYEGARTRAIAERAGVTEKTLFAHVGSKRALYEKIVYPLLLELLEPQLFGDLQRLLEGDAAPDLRTLLLAIARNRIDFALGSPGKFRLVVQQALLDPDFRERFVRTWREKLLPGARAMLERARERGELRDLPGDAVLRALVGAVVGYAIFRTVLAPGTEVDDDEAVATLVDILLDGIGAR